MKVAFATRDGERIDEHFGRAGAFSIWDVTPTGGILSGIRQVSENDVDVDVVTTRGLGSVHDDAIAAKIAKLADCRIVYFTEIGGPSAAKLVQRGIMPLKAAEGAEIAAAVDALVETMRTRPAPWMRKALAADA